MNRHLTDLASVLIGQGPEITAAIYSGNENLFARCEAIKKLIVVRGLTDKWREKLTALVTTIQKDIGPARNRYVHDEWHDGHWGITRLEFRSTREKPQAFKKERLSTSRWHYGEAKKVRDLSGEIEIVTYQLQMACILISMHRRDKYPLRPFWRQRGLTELRKQIAARDADGA